ncbi:hypothetical protein SERLA73DRAFT_174236 [Serpula lacrymans var. lacrymans S7.3]|uniref:ACB domain-containing protein n=1 Tax=Serpula lacrymans var. lacrymans (strain S7.3) TaxID=936435 RepID=F8PF28_SERL3|nr:hypothetical protein SERLA73DRAFT_174236 [Serpula lacrymans var. lacrymans S7.3]
MAYTPSPDFENAAAYLSSSSSPSGISNSTKLELYGLFKCLTISPIPTGSRPSIFDITGRAKWDAWKSAGTVYQSRGSDAEKRYLEIAQGLGWVQGAAPDAPTKNEDADMSDDIWDSDLEGGSPAKGGGGGLGNHVSSIAPPSQNTNGTKTLHDVAISGDAQKVSAFFEANPQTDVNERDEYGYTALHLACDRGSLEVVEVLLSNGADPNIKDLDDFTASELADVAGHSDIAALFKR